MTKLIIKYMANNIFKLNWNRIKKFNKYISLNLINKKKFLLKNNSLIYQKKLHNLLQNLVQNPVQNNILKNLKKILNLLKDII